MGGQAEEPLLAGAGGAARALAGVPRADNDGSTRFAVATARRGATNELRVLEVDEESWSVHTVGSTPLQSEVTCLSFALPSAERALCAVVGLNPLVPSGSESKGSRHGTSSAVIASLPHFNESSAATLIDRDYRPELSVECALQVSGRGREAFCRQASFSPFSDGDFVALACEGELSWHRLKADGSKKDGSCEASCAGDSRYRSVACNPHSATSIAATRGTSTELYDTRSNTNPKVAIGTAHDGACRSVDFGPHSEYLIATCGDDACMRLWDTRKVHQSIALLTGHTHFTWQARFNGFHEQLLVSASSDCSAGLWSLGCSAPSASDGEKPSASADENEDRLVTWIEDHPDSVYAVEWSHSDPWTFASLSHDGVVVISCVPRSLRYRILL